MLKVDDYLICHTTTINGIWNIVNDVFTVGEKYKITEINSNKIFLLDDNSDTRSFSLKSFMPSYYKHWFTNIKEERLEKLDNLEL